MERGGGAKAGPTPFLGGVAVRIDPRKFFEFLVLLMLGMCLTLLYMYGLQNSYGAYATSMLQ